MRSKIYRLEIKFGSKKCNSKRCLVCLNVSEINIFQSLQTQEQYKINHQLNCNDECLIYLLSCKVCGLQHVSFRLNNYKENSWKQKQERNICSHLFLNISLYGYIGFLDCSINVTNKRDGIDLARRDKYQKKNLKTVTPYALNTVDKLYHLNKFIKSYAILCIF